MSNFVGSYVNDMKLILTASALARQNAIMLGAPGFGKTAVTRSLAGQLTSGQYAFARIDPSTPPDVVRGAYNPAALLDGRLERVVDGTAYDPNMRLALIDEIGRGNEVTFDALLDTLDRLDSPDAPPVWATSNFMPSNERVAALIDRFALWYWINPQGLDVAAISAAQLNGQGPQVDVSDLPTWHEVQDIRKAAPGGNAIKAIGELLENLSTEAQAQGHRPHPRRVTQWTHVLFRVGVWQSGSADFSTVPDTAARLLRYCWPAIQPSDAATWAQIAASVVDTLGAAIEDAMNQVLAQMKQVSAAPQAQRTALIPQLATTMQSVQTTLESLAGADNQRVAEAVTTMNGWLSLAIQGKPVE